MLRFGERSDWEPDDAAEKRSVECCPPPYTATDVENRPWTGSASEVLVLTMEVLLETSCW